MKMKRHVSLDHVLKHSINNEKHRAVLEHRPKKYLFGTLNYGEIKGWYNEADGDCWDVFVPGMGRKLPLNKPMKIKKILGVLFLENYNHKIAIQVYYPDFDIDAAKEEITRYSQNYTSKMHKLGCWMDLETIQKSGMNTTELCKIIFN